MVDAVPGCVLILMCPRRASGIFFHELLLCIVVRGWLWCRWMYVVDGCGFWVCFGLGLLLLLLLFGFVVRRGDVVDESVVLGEIR